MERKAWARDDISGCRPLYDSPKELSNFNNIHFSRSFVIDRRIRKYLQQQLDPHHRRSVTRANVLALYRN